MAILIDGRYLRGPSRGIGYFLKNIIASLPSSSSPIYLLCPSGSHEPLPTHLTHNIRLVTAPWLGHFLWEQVTLPLYIKFLSPKVVYSPGNTGPLIRPRKPKYVATIHDISYLQPFSIVPFPWTSPRQLLGRVYRAYVVPKVIKSYDYIVTVSQFALNDIKTHFPQYAYKTDYIYHGQPASQVLPQVKSPSKNLVCITGSDPQKNSASLLAALTSIDSLFGWKIHFVGLGSSLNSQLLPNGCSILFHGSLSQQQLAVLMSYAYGMILPSHYESFGLPILDANRALLYLALSETGAFPEIAANTSIYFNPKSELSLSNAIQILIKSYPLPPKTTFLTDNLSRFPTWHQVSSYYLDLFHSVTNTL